MKIVIISDTHEKHNKIQVPDGDLLIHCGDWTNQGTPNAMEDFLKWFSGQPHKHKVFIPGNHELSLDSVNKKHALEFVKSFTNDNLHFLLNSSVVIKGLNIYGSPTTPFFFNWAFNFQRGKDIAAEWAKIPDNTNILISHGPPYGILDMVENSIENFGRDLHQGCHDLLARTAKLKDLKVHVFGHLHTDGGKSVKVNGVIHANAAICNERYLPNNPPIIIDL